MSKARKEFLNRVQIKHKSKIPAAQVSIHEIVGAYRKREDVHMSHSRSLSFSAMNGTDTSENSTGTFLPRAKTAGSVSVNRKLLAEYDIGSGAVGPESLPFTTTLPNVNMGSSRERSHTSGETVGRRNIVFSTVDRGLNINKGLRLGENSEDYRPLSAAVCHRLINSTTVRIVHDKVITNLTDYDERKISSM